MAFTDPQSITISGVTTPLPRTSTGVGTSTYTSADGLIDLVASSSYGRRTRRTMRLDLAKITADPFIPAQNQKVSMSVYTVFDLPPVGYTNADALAAWVGYRTALAATSDALVSKLLGGES